MIRYDKILFTKKETSIKSYWIYSLICLVIFVISLVIIGNLYFVKTYSLTAIALSNNSLKIVFPSNQEDIIYKSNTINIGQEKDIVDSIEIVGNQLVDGVLLTEANIKTNNTNYLVKHYYEVSFQGDKENLWDYLVTYGKEVIK